MNSVKSDTYHHRFSKEVIAIGIMSFLVSLSNILLLPLITRSLGAEDYGLWVQVQTTVGLIVPIAGLGLPFAMVRFLAGEKNRKQIQEGFYSIVGVVLICNLIISAALIAFPDFIASLFFDGASQVVRLTGFISLAFALDGVYLAFFRSLRHINTYAIINTAQAYVEIGVIAFLVMHGAGILGALIALLTMRTTLFLVLFFVIKSEIGLKFPDFSRVREFMSFGVPTIAAAIAGWVVSLSDRYVIAYFLGAGWVGIYAAGSVIGHSVTLFTGIFSFVMPAALSQLYDEQRIEEVKALLRYSLKYTLALLIPLVFGAAVLARPLLAFFSTDEIAAKGYLVVPFIALGLLLVTVSDIIGKIIILVKKTRIVALIWATAAAFNLISNILVIPHLGILGAALTTLISYLIATVIAVYYSFKEFTFPIDWDFIVKSIIASAIMAVGVWLMAPSGNVMTLAAVAAGVAIYGVAIFLLKGFSRDEVRFFRQILTRSKEN